MFDEKIANQIKLDLEFKIKHIKLAIGRFDSYEGVIPCLEFHIDDVESRIKICRWDLVVVAAIRRLVLSEMSQHHNGAPIRILSTPEDIHLLRVTYRQVTEYGITYCINLAL